MKTQKIDAKFFKKQGFNAYETFVRHEQQRDEIEITQEKFIDFVHWLYETDENVKFKIDDESLKEYFNDKYEYVDNDPDWMTHSNELMDSM